MQKKSTEKRIRVLIDKKERLLQSLKEKVLFWQNNRIKMYIKDLSPACKSCFLGSSIDININHICTRKCFYCPVPVIPDWKPYIVLEHLEIDTLSNLMDFLRKFNVRVVSFSGGDPLLSFDLLIKYLNAIREAFGKSIYTMVYTNGDLLTEKRAQALAETDLNEIRINLSARDYDLAPIIIARRHIKRVVVSSPAVPAEKKKIMDALKKLDELQVDNINLIELMAAQQNFKEMAKRKYIMKPNTAIAESEIAFYEIMQYALKNKHKTPIHFCTADYKAKSCRRGRNQRYAPYAKEEHESLTVIGKIRQLFELDKNRKKHFLSSETPLQKGMSSPKGRIHIQYYNTYVKRVDKNHEGKKIRINDDFFLGVEKRLSKKIVLKGSEDALLYQILFLDNKPLGDAVRELFNSRPGTYRNEARLYQKILSFYQDFEDEEFFGDPSEF